MLSRGDVCDCLLFDDLLCVVFHGRLVDDVGFGSCLQIPCAPQLLEEMGLLHHCQMGHTALRVVALESDHDNSLCVPFALGDLVVPSDVLVPFVVLVLAAYDPSLT